MPIPNSLQSAAPATIALWYVDEASGLWKEEGSATKQGNTYVGSVKHFTFWNCDFGSAGIYLNLTFHNGSGAPLAQTAIWLSAPSGFGWDMSSYGITDSLGQVSGFVPSGTPITLRVQDACFASVFTQVIGPFSQNTTVVPITVSGTQIPMMTLSGKLLSCNSAPVTNGYAVVDYGYHTTYIATDAAGHYSVTLPYCAGVPGVVFVRGVDVANLQQSSPQPFTISATVDAGTITLCNSVQEEYIRYQVDGTSYNITNLHPGDSVMTVVDGTMAVPLGSSTVYGRRATGQEHCNFQFDHPGTAANANYPLNWINVNNYGQVTLLPGSTVSTTHIAQAAGEVTEGTISASFKDAQNVTHTLSGSFRAPRYY
jgi:hypothetical protein